jgi:TIR domain-containing protein
MTARVFISYRSSDGADKATALARDLDARFGSAQVFIDKEDLPPGARWRDAIASTLQECPILLLLITPDYLGATDAGGKRCIEREDDPARAELDAGLAAKAHIIPLLCDGVTALPEGASLPQPFAQLSELQWGRLRAYDWREDFDRLADDLRRLGVTPVAVADTPDARDDPRQPTTTPLPLEDLVSDPSDGHVAMSGRRLAVGATALAALFGLGGWGLWRWRKRQAANLSGAWSARIGARGAPDARGGAFVILTLDQQGRKLTLASASVDIQRDPDWQGYREFWRQRNGTELRRVFYRGEGRILGDDEYDDDEDESGNAEAASAAARAPLPDKTVPVRRVAVAIRIMAPGEGGEPIDGGALHGSVDLDAQRIHGRLWLNSEQAERVVELKRGG